MGGERKHTQAKQTQASRHTSEADTQANQTKMDPDCDFCGDPGCVYCDSDGDNDYNLAQYNSDDDE